MMTDVETVSMVRQIRALNTTIMRLHVLPTTTIALVMGATIRLPTSVLEILPGTQEGQQWLRRMERQKLVSRRTALAAHLAPPKELHR
jgi:hypothetical protein